MFESVKLLLVCAIKTELLKNHWQVCGVQAVADTVKLAVVPARFVWLCGWLKITGGGWSWAIILFVEYTALPDASLTVMTTVLEPSGKKALLVGLCEMVSAPDKSVARIKLVP